MLGSLNVHLQLVHTVHLDVKSIMKQKHTSVSDRSEKIYRVSNEWNYVSLCGAGRYGYDFENNVEGKDEKSI